jgi:AraC-like DNA-binding protein
MAADATRLSSRTLAQGPDWAVWDVNCTLGPHDRPFEERHAFTSIAAVLRGTFHYRSAQGSELLYPGSFLLGNAGACFECGHEQGTGDRCIAFGFAPSLFEEIAASAGGTSKYRFRAARLPSLPATTAFHAAVETRAAATSPRAAEELAIGLAERVIRTTSAFVPRAAAPSARDLRRIADALRFIDEHYREPLDLARLAQVALMSRYHFLRTFRKVVGATPHRYLLGVRLRRSAARLASSDDPVLEVASEAGFGDLSTFYAHFRNAFGCSPQSHRGRCRSAVAPVRGTALSHRFPPHR